MFRKFCSRWPFAKLNAHSKSQLSKWIFVLRLWLCLCLSEWNEAEFSLSHLVLEPNTKWKRCLHLQYVKRYDYCVIRHENIITSLSPYQPKNVKHCCLLLDYQFMHYLVIAQIYEPSRMKCTLIEVNYNMQAFILSLSFLSLSQSLFRSIVGCLHVWECVAVHYVGKFLVYTCLGIVL